MDDLVEAFLLARENVRNLSGRAFNIGGGPGNELSLLDLVELIEELCGERPRYEFQDWRSGDQRYYVSNTRKFRTATGWCSRIRPHAGVQKLYEELRKGRGLEPQIKDPPSKGKSKAVWVCPLLSVRVESGGAIHEGGSHNRTKAICDRRCARALAGAGAGAHQTGRLRCLWIQSGGLARSPTAHYGSSRSSGPCKGWGIVDLLGDGVRGLHAGERVALLSYHAYAEYDLAEADQVVRVPPQTEVFPGEALGCAINIFKRSDVQAGQTVAILGVGFLGALLTQLCTAAGARAIVLSRRQFALDVGRAAGAAEALDLRDPGAAARANELTNGRGCERVIEAAGEQETLDLAGEIIGIRGRLIIAATTAFTAPGEYAIMELAGYRRRQRARA